MQGQAWSAENGHNNSHLFQDLQVDLDYRQILGDPEIRPARVLL